MSTKIHSALVVTCSLMFLLLGYWLGNQKAQVAISARLADEVLHATVEARHDGAMVQLLSDEKYSDAENVAQLRYYSRLLLLADTSSSAIGNAVPAEVEKTLTEAKARWRKNQYVVPDARDHERLIRLMR